MNKALRGLSVLLSLLLLSACATREDAERSFNEHWIGKSVDALIATSNQRSGEHRATITEKTEGGDLIVSSTARHGHATLRAVESLVQGA